MTRATVITDASFCDKEQIGGWAAWVRIDGRAEPIKKYADFRVPVRNSREAEMFAAVNGIWLAAKYGATEVLVQTDCVAVVDMLNGATQKKSLKRDFAAAMQKAGVAAVKRSAKHVRGHTTVSDARSYVNRWCDKMAKTAMRRQRCAR